MIERKNDVQKKNQNRAPFQKVSFYSQTSQIIGQQLQ